MAEDFAKTNTQIAFRIEKTGTGNAKGNQLMLENKRPYETWVFS